MKISNNLYSLIILTLLIFNSGCLELRAPSHYKTKQTESIQLSSRENSKTDQYSTVSSSSRIAFYNANDSRLFHHSSSTIVGAGRSMDINSKRFEFLTYGPYTSDVAPGSYTARFVLKIDNNRADDMLVAAIDVFDSKRNQILSRQEFSRKEFADQMKETNFDLNFDVLEGAVLEYRVQYYQGAYIEHISTSIYRRNSYVAYYEGSDSRLFHGSIGYKKGNSWVTNASKTEGIFSYGPYTRDLAPGNYVAQFSLLVDNAEADNLPIASIDVYDAARGTVLAQRTLRRRGFQKKGMITDFDLNFQSSSGSNLEFRIAYLGNSYLEHIKTVIKVAPKIPFPQSTRKKIVFSLDQGFGNGVVVQNDLAAVRSIARELAPLKLRYDVYVVLNPMVSNKQFLYEALDTLVEEEIPFVFDLYTSDGISLGYCTQGDYKYANPNYSEATTIPLKDLHYYKNRYKGFFAGMRVMEMIGQDNLFDWDLTNAEVLKNNEDWKFRECWRKHFDKSKKAYAVFNPVIVETMTEFAQAHGQFIELSDHSWSFTLNKVDRASIYESDIKRIIQASGGKQSPIFLTFANNHTGNNVWDINKNSTDWDKVARSDFYKWSQGLREISGKENSVRIGLSNQSWVCGDEGINWMTNSITCSAISNMMHWTWGALLSENNSDLIQYESVWYLFNLPPGVFWYDASYMSNSKFPPDKRATARPSFQTLRQMLLTL